MEKLKKLVDSKPELKSEKSQYLKIKDASGPIRVKLVGCENAQGKDYETQKPIQGVNLLFEQEGEKKKYFVPTLGKDGKYHYLIERFADIEEGTEVMLEFKRKPGSVQGFIDVQVVDEEGVDQEKEDDIPVVEEPDFKNETSEENIGSGDDIEIPGEE